MDVKLSYKYEVVFKILWIDAADAGRSLRM